MASMIAREAFKLKEVVRWRPVVSSVKNLLLYFKNPPAKQKKFSVSYFYIFSIDFNMYCT